MARPYRLRVRHTTPGGPAAVAVEEFDLPRLGPTDVLVETEWCSVNFPDRLMTRAGYQLKPRVPFTLGSEAVGRVVARGPEASALREGDRVLAMTWYGAFSSHLVLDSEFGGARDDAMELVRDGATSRTVLRAPLHVVPPRLDPREVAATGLSYSSSHHALTDRARLAKGERLLVLGAAGSLGLAAVQIGTALGAEVVALCRPGEERVCAEGLRGAPPRTFDYSWLTDDARRKSPEFGPFDVVVDVLGGPYTLPALKALAPGGRLLVLGFVAEPESPQVKTGIVLIKEAEVIGVRWGGWAAREPRRQRDHMRQLLRWLADGTIRPRIGGVYDLREAAAALADMEAGRVHGKVLLRTGR